MSSPRRARWLALAAVIVPFAFVPRGHATPAAPADRDGDGIPDSQDRCPDDPEDRDGFQDDDGCPDPDNDQDGIPDVDDKCPSEPETYNGYQDDDGCPDRAPVAIKPHPPAIRHAFLFHHRSVRTLKSSEWLFRQVLQVFRQHPEIRLVEVQGYADEHPAAAADLRLSRARAEAVKKRLVQLGVPAEKLIARGYGRSQRWGNRGHPQNRRVMLLLLKPRAAPRVAPRAVAPRP